jgi:nucleotide-binding universal stress UspA family protein
MSKDMGASGHSSVRESIVGGITRDFHARSPVPVLIAS